eukprot:578036_1
MIKFVILIARFKNNPLFLTSICCDGENCNFGTFSGIDCHRALSNANLTGGAICGLVDAEFTDFEAGRVNGVNDCGCLKCLSRILAFILSKDNERSSTRDRNSRKMAME